MKYKLLRHTHECRHHNYYNEELQWLCNDSEAMLSGIRSSLPRRSNIFIRKTLEIILKSYLFGENDLKHEIT